MGNMSIHVPDLIEFQQTIPLVIHLVVQGVLAWLDHWISLVHYMNYQPKPCSKYGLDSWLPSWMNSGIYTNEACIFFDYNQLTLCT